MLEVDEGVDSPDQIQLPSYITEDFDIVSIIDAAYDKDTKVIRDLRVDDRDLPRAKNFFHFCSEFLSPDAKMPFMRQMWIAYHLLAEFCPKCSDPKWASVLNVPVDFDTRNSQEHVQFLEDGVCPKCKATKSGLIRAQKLNHYQEMNIVAGQRAGKSTVTATLSAYLTHCMLKMPNLASLCDGIQADTPLTGTFVGLRFEDSFKLLWTPYINLINSSPWFQQYHAMLEHYSEKYSKELLKQRDIYIRYPHKNLDIYPSGSNKRGLRGRTRVFSAIDELGWFPLNSGKADDDGDGDRERADADEVYIALDRSLLTVRSEVHSLVIDKGFNTIPTGINMCISSPASWRDKICRLLKENENSTTALALRLATWEMSPRFTRNHPAIVAAYKSNAVRAERDYGANPPKTVNAFISNEEVRNCFTGVNRAQVTVIEKLINGKGYLGAKVSSTSPLNEHPASVMAIDAGYSNNSFALTIGHRDGAKAIIDVLIEVQTKKDFVIHYNAMFLGVIRPLIPLFNVQWLFADRWQSLSILHRTQEEDGIKADQYSVKKADFDLTRSMLEDIQFQTPKLEGDFLDNEVMSVNYPRWFARKPALHLLFQCLTVREVGNTVAKGDGFTDDLFRALVLMTGRLFDPKVEKHLATFQSKKRASRFLGVAKGKAASLGSGGFGSATKKQAKFSMGSRGG